MPNYYNPYKKRTESTVKYRSPYERTHTVTTQSKSVPQDSAQNEKAQPKNDTNAVRRGIETYMDLNANISTGMLKSVEGIADLLIGVVGGVGGIFSKDFKESVEKVVAYDVTKNAYSKYADKLTKNSYLNEGKIGETVEQVAQGVGGMLPAVLAAVATGGTSLAANAAMGASKAAQIASLATMGAGAAGQSTEQALNEGAELENALAYGALSGATEVATEKLTGGLTKGVFGKGVVKAGEGVAKTGAKRIVKGMAEEAVEEMAAEAVNPLISVTYKGKDALKDYSDPEFYKGVGEAGVVGGLTGLTYSQSIGRILDKSRGTNPDIDASLAAVSELGERQLELYKKGTLDGKGYANIQSDIKSNIGNVEKVLKKASPEKRDRLISTYRLGDLFENDGGVRREYTELLDKRIKAGQSGRMSRYVSPDLAADEKRLMSDLASINRSRADGEPEVKIFEGELGERGERSFTKLKRIEGNLNTLTGKGFNVSLVNSDVNFKGVTVRGENIYINAALVKSDSFVPTLIHELTHFTEGSEEYVRLKKMLLADRERTRRSASELAGEGNVYGFTQEHLRDFLKSRESEQVGVDKKILTQYSKYNNREKSNTSAEFKFDIDRWVRNGRHNDGYFEFGMTGDILQGLGAIESDIYMLGSKINAILQEHKEMTLEDIKKIPEILQNPVLILKSKNIGRDDKQNTKLILFGRAKTQNEKPIMCVFDLKPNEKNFIIDDMQKVTSAYTKTNNAKNFLKSSDVLYMSKGKATSLLRSIGFQIPIELNESGFIGSISYIGRNVNISGKKFSDVFRISNTEKSKRTTPLLRSIGFQTPIELNESGTVGSISQGNDNVNSGFEKNSNKKYKSTQYSFDVTVDGRLVAVVDDDILNNIYTGKWDTKTAETAKKAAAAALLKFKDGIAVNGITAKVNRVSRNEYTRPHYAMALQKHDSDTYADKLRAAGVIDDVVIAATDWKKDDGLKHKRKDNISDFYTGKTYIMSDKNKYTATVLLGLKKSGDFVFYDVVNIKPTEFKIKNVEAFTSVETNKMSNSSLMGFDDDSISQNSDNVNSKGQKNADTPSDEEFVSELVAGIAENSISVDRTFVDRLVRGNTSLVSKILNKIEDSYAFFASRRSPEMTERYKRLKQTEGLFLDALKSKGKAYAGDKIDGYIEHEYDNNGVKFSIEKTSKMPYSSQIIIENKKINGSNSLYIGTPSKSLQNVGISNAPFVMNQSDYRKSRREHTKNKKYSNHNVPFEFFKNMPEYLNSAPIIIDNGMKLSVITSYPMKDTKENNSYVICGVWKDQTMEKYTVNLVKSVYPWDDFYNRITNASKNGSLVIINKSKAEQILHTIGIQPSEVSNIISLARNSISQTNSNVNRNSGKNSKETIDKSNGKEDLSQVNPQLYEWLGTVNEKSSNGSISQNNIDVNEISENNYDNTKAVYKQKEGGKGQQLNMNAKANPQPTSETLVHGNATNSSISQTNSNVNENSENNYDSVINVYKSDFDGSDGGVFTDADVKALWSVGRKSINAFSEQEMQGVQKWERKLWRELGEKSPFFRARFGDWRAYDASPVNTVEIQTVDFSNVDMPYGDYYIADTDWLIHAGITLKDETEHYARGEKISYRVLNDIKQILENAVLLDTEVSMRSSNNKSNGTALMHKLYTPIIYGGRPFIAQTSIEEFVNLRQKTVQRKIYHLQAIRIEPTDGHLTEKSAITPRSNIGSVYSVADLFEIVKRYDKNFNPTSASEELADAVLGDTEIYKVQFSRGSVSENERLKRQNSELEDKLKHTGELMHSISKLKAIKDGLFVSASDYKSDIFKNSIERLTAIDFHGTVNASAARRTMSGLCEWYKTDNPMLCYEEGASHGYYSDYIADMLERLSKGKKVLSAKELSQIKTVVDHFTHIADTYNKTFDGKKWTDAATGARKFIRNAQGSRQVQTGAFYKAMSSGYMRNVADPAAVFRAADAYNKNGFFTTQFEALRRGLIDMSVKELELFEKHDAFLNKKENRDYADRLTATTVNYQGTEMTVGQLISLYMTAKRGHAWRGLVNNGFSVFDSDGVRHDAGGIRGSGEAVSDEGQIREYIRKMQNELSALLTDRDMEYIKILEDMYSECALYKQSTDIKRLGVSNVLEGYYYPIRRLDIRKTADTSFFNEVNRAANQPFNKKTEKSSARLFIEPSDTVLRRHTRGVLLYSEIGIWSENINRLLNVEVGMAKHGKLTLRSELQKSPYTSKVLDELIKLKKDIEGIGGTDDVGYKKLMSRLRTAYAKAVLMANPKVLINQNASCFAAANILDYSCIAHGHSVDGIFDEVDIYCPLARLRNSNRSVVKAQTLAENIGKFSDRGMKPIAIVDRMVVARLFGSCQLQIERDGGAKLGTVQNKKAAGELLEKVILETQQSYLLTERSGAMRSNDELKKAFVMFMSDAMKVTGRVLDGYGEYSVTKRRLKQLESMPNKNAALLASLEKERKSVAESLQNIYSEISSTHILPYMSEEERYYLLKNAKIVIENTKYSTSDLFDISEIEKLPPKAKSQSEKIIIPMAERLGIFGKSLKTPDVDFEFVFSKNKGLVKSLNSQLYYGGTYSDFAKVIVNLDTVLKNAVLIEQHEDKYTSLEKNIEAVYVLLSALKDGNTIIPIELEIKKFKKEGGRLYLNVAMEKIEADVMASTVNQNIACWLVSASTYSISDIFANVNPIDKKFLKYVPDKFLSTSQKNAKIESLKEEKQKHLKKQVIGKNDGYRNITKTETGVVENTVSNSKKPTLLLPVSNISKPQLLEKINIKDKKFFKYIPDELLSKEQIEAKRTALDMEDEKYGRSIGDRPHVQKEDLSISEKLSFVKSQYRIYSEQISELEARLAEIEEQTDRAENEKQYLKSELDMAGKRLCRSLAALTSVSIFLALTSLIVKSLFGKNKDKEPEEIAADTVTDIFGNMIGGLPLFNDIYDFFANGYDVDIFAIDMLNGCLDSCAYSVKLFENAVNGESVSEAQIRTAVKKSLMSGGMMLGLPVRNVYNYTSGFLHKFAPSSGYKFDSLFGSEVYSKDLKNAIESGDERLIATVSGLMTKQNMGVQSKSVQKALARLVGEGYDVLPRSVGDTVTYKGSSVTLTAKQKKAFRRTYGKSDESIERLVRFKEFERSPSDIQAKAIRFAYDLYWQMALDELLGEDIQSKTLLFAEAIEPERLALIVCIARSIEADRDKNGKTVEGSRKKKIMAFLQAQRLTAAQKYMIAGYLGYKNTNGEREVVSYISRLRLSAREKSKLLEYSGYTAA